MAEEGKVKVVQRNRKAFFQYEILDRMEAGMVLKGSEVKSIRDGRVSIHEAYAKVRGSEVWVVGMDISLYPQAGPQNHEPLRPRKLLLHRREIGRLAAKVKERGLTLVPLSLYFKHGRAKLEIALARGKVKHDKRQAMRKKEADREIRRRMMK